KIDHQNRRRVVRAIEVIRLTGRPFSEQRSVWTKTSASSEWPSEVPQCLVLTRPLPELYRRIDDRVEAIFEQGLVTETKELLSGGLERNRTASQALGYRQVIEHLQGRRPIAETIALVKQKTRQYAKRQLTWFRHKM